MNSLKKIKVLHIAGFNGNIGDIANHCGFRKSLKSFFPDKLFEYENLEMRTFYKSYDINKFDSKFVAKANEYDLVIIGGGGFFDLRWDYSVTGTTIDISEEILNLIHTPILFNGLGYWERTKNDNLYDRFYRFLNKILSDTHCFVTVRNDGSYQEIINRYNLDSETRLLEVPDGGFFCEPPKINHPEIDPNCINIAINIAGDDLCYRFEGTEWKITLKSFIDEITDSIVKIANNYPQARFIFVPHIPSDMQMIAYAFDALPDRLLRNRVSCAPYLNGVNTDGLAVFDLYRECDLVIGMRYHANVVPFGCCIPTIAVFTLDKHMELYKNLSVEKRCIEGNRFEFSVELLNLVSDVLCNKDKYIQENKRVLVELEMANEKYMTNLKKWFSELGL